jgi:hypothetical protein
MRDVVAWKRVPVSVIQVVRPNKRDASRAARWTNTLLLLPVVGAFVQIVWLRTVPSLAWPFMVLFAAFATRILKMKYGFHERPALLGADGVLLEKRFVAASEIAVLTRDADILRATTNDGERIELRLPDARAASSTAEALRAAVASEAKHVELSPTRDDRGVYRGGALDPERWLAVVEDVAVPPRTRIAAAGLLADHVDDAVRLRVTNVADTTANPSLREALLEAVTVADEPPRARLGARSRRGRTIA